MATDDQGPHGDGVRFELRLLNSDAGAASYRLSLRVREVEWVGDADVTAPTGEVAFHFSEQPEPPAAALALVRAQLRLIYRERERAGFPRRITRWRPLPAGNESA